MAGRDLLPKRPIIQTGRRRGKGVAGQLAGHHHHLRDVPAAALRVPRHVPLLLVLSRGGLFAPHGADTEAPGAASSWRPRRTLHHRHPELNGPLGQVPYRDECSADDARPPYAQPAQGALRVRMLHRGGLVHSCLPRSRGRGGVLRRRSGEADERELAGGVGGRGREYHHEWRRYQEEGVLGAGWAKRGRFRGGEGVLEDACHFHQPLISEG
mmetsp:Transcript_6003/g.20470  ORF Transcript_6003/g.20470 Transcript_6003/m.20470 type:complete len:212 (+) Transcript_6003:1660-2295(+)